MNVFYKNTPEVAEQRSAIMKRLQRDGIHVSEDKETNAALRALAHDVLPVIAGEAFAQKRLALLFAYDRQEMPTKHRKTGGCTFAHMNQTTGEVAFSIGISTFALQMPVDGQIAILLHELAHVLSGADDGTEAFNAENAYLCKLFSERSGREIPPVTTIKEVKQ